MAAYDRARRRAERAPVEPIAPMLTRPVAATAPAIAPIDPPAPIAAVVKADVRVPEQAHQPTASAVEPQHQPERQLEAKPADTPVTPTEPCAMSLERTGVDVPMPPEPQADVPRARPNKDVEERRAEAGDTPATTQPAAIAPLPTPAQLAGRKRTTPHHDRMRALHHDGTPAENKTAIGPIDAPDPVRDAVDQLRDMPFIPVRERDGRLTIVLEHVIKEDADVLRRIAGVEQEAAIQAQLARARDAMLARLRNPDRVLGGKDKRRYDAAVRAAHYDPEIAHLMLARPSRAASTDVAALRARLRGRPEQERETGQGNNDDDALFEAMLARLRSGTGR